MQDKNLISYVKSNSCVELLGNKNTIRTIGTYEKTRENYLITKSSFLILHTVTLKSSISPLFQ